mgnify:CR=1 FL=1
MKRSVWVIGSVVVLVGLVAWLVLRPRSEHVAVDLLGQFPSAVEKRPTPETFSLIDATVAGVTKRAIYTKDSSRIAWNVTMPDNAWLLVSAALTEQAWTVEGDGVLFRISANDNELLNLVLNPFRDASVRKWQDFQIDLSEFAGQNLNLFLKTNASVSGAPNTNGDFAVWGNPRIVTR